MHAIRDIVRIARSRWAMWRAFEPGQLAWRLTRRVEASLWPWVPTRVGGTVDTSLPPVATAGAVRGWRDPSATLAGPFRDEATTPTNDPALHELVGHTHADVPGLAAHLASAADDDARDTAAAALLDRWTWFAAHPRRTSGALASTWHPWATSLRALHWLDAAARLLDARRADVLPDAFWPILHAHGAHVARFPERDIRGNHLLTNGLAILALGVTFADEDWIEAGAAIWTEDFRRQLRPDGQHRERSTAYHAEVVAAGLDAVALLRLAARLWPRGEAVANTLAARLATPYGRLRDATHPGGERTRLGDVGPMGVPSTAAISRRARGLGIGAATQAAAEVIRWRAGAATVFVNLGRFGQRTLPAHAHCDGGAIELSVGERPLIRGAGTLTYAAGPWRRYFRGASGHSALVGPVESSEIHGRFRVGRRAELRVLEVRSESVDLEVRGWFDARGPRLIWRRYVSTEPGRLTLVDHLRPVLGAATPPPPLSAQLRLSPDTALVHAHTRGVSLRTGDLEWRVEAPGARFEMGFAAPEHGRLGLAPLVRWPIAVGAPVEARITWPE